eukprot:TRINITY_DN8583_c0_g1_i1.p3 TRINITY_DN8583_c0_g1~~TRINITY_DN8583_c0_g1_i1.p3  ORF type:complete len:100 (+),score=13.21 TRINITY_DN8583_c0_g1_i1:124-423(+)
MIKNKNIIQLYDLYETKKHINLVFEYMDGGTLMERLKEQGKFSEEKSIIILSKLLKTLAFLHSNNILHRDLKPENIFLKYINIPQLIQKQNVRHRHQAS